MLKKLGMVTATAAAGLIALSPLAFATDKGGHHHGPDEVTNVSVDDDSVERNQVNQCEFDQEVANEGLGAILGLPTQIQTLNCVNIGDDSILPEPDPEPAPAPAPVVPAP